MVRLGYFLIFLACAALLGYAYWVEYYLLLPPCPLCIMQRVAFFAMGLFALIATLHGPLKKGARVYSGLISLAGIGGIALAARHVWIQNLPPERAPTCGAPIQFDDTPLLEWLNVALQGTGDCATIDWTFLGMSMPAWTLVCYVLLVLSAWIVVGSARKKKGLMV